jgi:hypothetical protein
MGAPNEGQTMLDTNMLQVLANTHEDDFLMAMELLDES